MFGLFASHALYRRMRQVSTLDLTFTGPTTFHGIEDIVKYAYYRNVTKMTMKWIPKRVRELPHWLFSCRTLKYLSLTDQTRDKNKSVISNSSWDFPALETLILKNIRLGDGSDKNLNLFSKCVNLKDLTLHECYMYGLESFTICATQLSNLTITKTSVFPMVFNVVAPQLETLTASVITENGALFSSINFLRLSTKGFSSLEKVNLYASNGRYKKEKLVTPLLDLFRVVRNAKYLILDVDIIEVYKYVILLLIYIFTLLCVCMKIFYFLIYLCFYVYNVSVFHHA